MMLTGQEVPGASDESELLKLLNTPVSSASKHEERSLEAPGLVSLVTRDQAEGYGWTSLNDVLYSLPGFGPSQDYDRRTVSSRGLYEGWNNNHILHLVDGIPFNDNLYGTATTWEISPLFMAKRVEVMRGPGSALYGSNATNGVVQVKSLSASDLPAPEVQARVGGRGERIYDFALGKEGDLAAAVVGFNAFETRGNAYEGYDGSGRLDARGKLATFRIGDARDSQYAWAKLEGRGALSGWTFQYHWQAWGYQTGHGWLWQAPDRPEHMQEKRNILALAYESDLGGNWRQEYLISYQRHDLNWNLRFYPDQALSGFYPAGVNEYLDTGATDLFGRAQWSLALPQESALLFGVEAKRFEYGGDRGHTSNIEMATFTPLPGNVSGPLGPWLAPILNHPMLDTGFYAQFTSGKLLGEHLNAVVGLRSDRSSVDYDAQGGVKSRSFSNTSPRFALVYHPSDTFSVKAMTGSAFRSPSPAELAGANTLTLGSNIQQLKPEHVNTTELAVDWIATPNLDWRTNVFRTRSSDQIAYSASNFNLSTNVYTLTTAGLETELLYGFKGWKGFLNYAFAKRLDESVQDATIAPSGDRLTWEPSHRIKAGVICTIGDFKGSLSARWQGAVGRRTSDVGTQPLPLVGTPLDVDLYRPGAVPSWTTFDLKAGWTLREGTSLSLLVTNLLDAKVTMVKTLAFPFDYQGEGRQWALILRTRL
jgi:iron complex outermembrane receptor protein